MLIAVPIGYLSVRRTGIYFAMVTLAFAQMIYFLANQWRGVTGGENGLQGIPRNFFGIELIEGDSFYFYYAGVVLILLGIFGSSLDRVDLARSPVQLMHLDQCQPASSTPPGMSRSGS